jgi:hypothetical protein
MIKFKFRNYNISATFLNDANMWFWPMTVEPSFLASSMFQIISNSFTPEFRFVKQFENSESSIAFRLGTPGPINFNTNAWTSPVVGFVASTYNGPVPNGSEIPLFYCSAQDATGLPIVLQPGPPAILDFKANRFDDETLVVVPLKNDLLEKISGISTSGSNAVINNLELDPFGKPGTAQFNNGEYISLASNTLSSYTSGNFTLSFFFKPTAWAPPATLNNVGFVSATLLELRAQSTNQVPFNLYITPGGFIGVGWVGGMPSTVSPSDSFNMGVWNYLKITREDDLLTIACNGEITILISNLQGVNLGSSNLVWEFGRFKPAPNFDSGSLIGFMSEIRFANFANETYTKIQQYPSDTDFLNLNSVALLKYVESLNPA